MEVVDDQEAGALMLYDAGRLQEAVRPTNLVGWHRLGNRLTVVVRHRGAARDIFVTLEVPVAPGNERAPAVLASWIPAGLTVR